MIVYVLFVHKKSVSLRKVCIIFIKKLKIIKNPKTPKKTYLGGFLCVFFWWVFYCQPWAQAAPAVAVAALLRTGPPVSSPWPSPRVKAGPTASPTAARPAIGKAVAHRYVPRSVKDPDPQDPHVLRPPGSGSISQRYGSGSFPFLKYYLQNRILKNWK